MLPLISKQFVRFFLKLFVHNFFKLSTLFNMIEFLVFLSAQSTLFMFTPLVSNSPHVSTPQTIAPYITSANAVFFPSTFLFPPCLSFSDVLGNTLTYWYDTSHSGLFGLSRFCILFPFFPVVLLGLRRLSLTPMFQRLWLSAELTQPLYTMLIRFCFIQFLSSSYRQILCHLSSFIFKIYIKYFPALLVASTSTLCLQASRSKI